MENQKEEYKNIFWNKYDILKQRFSLKSQFYKSYQKQLGDLLNLFKIFENSFNSIKIIEANDENNEDEKLLLKLTNFMIDIIKYNMNCYSSILKEMTEKVKKGLDKIKNSKINVNNFTKRIDTYKAKEIKLSEAKELYHKNGIIAEKLVFQNLSLPEKQQKKETELNICLNKTKESFKNYMIQLDDINQFLKIYNEEQSTILEDCYNLERKVPVKFLLKNLNDKMKDIIGYLTKQFGVLNMEKFDKNKNIETILNLARFDIEKKKDKEKFVDFPSEIEKVSNPEQYSIYQGALEYMKQNIDRRICKNYSMKIEFDKNNYQDFLLSFFKPNLKIDEKMKIKFFDCIKKPYILDIYISCMNKHRINSEQSKDWINLMSQGITKILETSIQINKFQIIKNLILLAQTYFYKENDKKIFIFEEMVKNQNYQLQDLEFWKKFIEHNLIIEFQVFKQKNNITNLNLLNKKSITIGLHEQLKELFLTILTPYVNNLIEFKIKKEDILKIVNYFKEKYNFFINEEFGNTMNLIINNSNN